MPDRTDVGERPAHHRQIELLMMPMPRTRDPGSAKRTVVGKSTRRTRASETTDAAKPPALPLPHERDQTTRQKDHPADAVIDQAKQDVENGLQDTDLRGSAGEIFDRRWKDGRTPKS